MSTVDWSHYRKCTACLAELGQPCQSLDGVVVNGVVTEIRLTVKDEPHRARKPRSIRNGGAR